MNTEEISQLLQTSGAFLTGHFSLTSGRHSNAYIEKIKLIQDPEKVVPLCAELKNKFAQLSFDYVISPALGGIVLGYEVARQMNKKFIFTQRKNDVMTIRSGFTLPPHAKVIIVEDIITTGGSVFEVINCLKSFDADIQGIGVIVDRSGGAVRFDYPVFPLLQVKFETYDPAECPMCAKNIPMTIPGSSGKEK